MKCDCCSQCTEVIAEKSAEFEAMMAGVISLMKAEVKTAFLEVLKDLETTGIAFFVKEKVKKKEKN